MNTLLSNKFAPDYKVHPGVTLEETLESVHMSQNELAIRTGRPIKTISEIVNGVTSITPETAIQLESVLGVPAEYWNSLQKNYQEQIAKQDFKQTLTPQIEAMNEFPYALMANYGWVKATCDPEEKVENLLSFFGVTSMDLITKTMPIAFRTHQGARTSSQSLAAWIRKGEIDAIAIKTKPFNEKKLKEYLNEIRGYTRKAPREFRDELRKKLAECGIALVFTKGLPKTYICGATRWLSTDKAMIQLSIRGSFADIMWFTFYHEIGHILLHGKKEKFIDLEKVRGDNSNKDEQELEADNFAAEMLIPERNLKEFLRGIVNIPAIQQFAREMDVHPGIIVGRLQFLGKLPFSKLNYLRVKYAIGEDPESSS